MSMLLTLCCCVGDPVPDPCPFNLALAYDVSVSEWHFGNQFGDLWEYNGTWVPNAASAVGCMWEYNGSQFDIPPTSCDSTVQHPDLPPQPTSCGSIDCDLRWIRDDDIGNPLGVTAWFVSLNGFGQVPGAITLAKTVGDTPVGDYDILISSNPVDATIGSITVSNHV